MGWGYDAHIKDHVKLILCPVTRTGTVVDSGGKVSVYELGRIREHGCGEDLRSRLIHAQVSNCRIGFPSHPTFHTFRP